MRLEILNTVDDLVKSFFLYDRKEDEDLPEGEIEEAIADGVLTIEEIVDHFRKKVNEHMATFEPMEVGWKPAMGERPNSHSLPDNPEFDE